MCDPARRFNCARCGCQVVICPCCDRGNRYGKGCAPARCLRDLATDWALIIIPAGKPGAD